MEEEHQTNSTAGAHQDMEARFFSPELTSALIDLARLAREAGAARSEQGTHDIATALLMRLLSFCAAQRGAVLLVSAQPASLTSVSAQAQAAVRPLRLLACQGMHEQEVAALAPLLPALPSDLSTIQGGSALSCWLISHYVLNGGAIDQPMQNHQEGVPEPGKPPEQAYILLGWDGLSDQPCIPVMEQSRTILPKLSDAIAAILSSMQLAVRVQELETQGGEAMGITEPLSSDLLAVVSHELRSPLTAIKGYASTLLRHTSRLSREERSQFLRAISDASDRLDQLVGRLLELAQLENGSIPFVAAPVDPARLAEAALLTAEMRAERSAPGLFIFHLRLETTDGEEATSVPITWADLRLLREALDTLLDNAVKYSPEGGVITVLLRQTTLDRIASILPATSGEPDESLASVDRLAASSVQDRSEALLEICVCDQGIGIPAAHSARVFERFYQVDRGLTREAGGAGLGLSLCKRIVELHHGRIWVESTPGEGSTFHLVMPILPYPALEQGQERMAVEQREG
jgi:signal transduction histidine kinase